MRPRKPAVLPSFCDYACEYAAFAPNDASGACRREQAVYCSLTKQYNNKNARCIATARIIAHQLRTTAARRRKP